jgi:peptidoglycan/LPS O-acetylase OafA/YrhL
MNNRAFETADAADHNAWLDVCRSLAIVMVLLSHGRHFLKPVWEQSSVFRVGGFLGVELFFVLSGFLIGRTLMRTYLFAQRDPHWLRNFLFRRWLRTLPVFYLFLGINVVLISHQIAPGSIFHLLPTAFFLQNFAWPGPQEFGEAWSLSVEEMFYLIFPISLWIGEKLTPDRRFVFFGVTLLLLLVPLLLRMAYVGTYSPSWDEGVRKIVVLRLDALMLGVLLGWLIRKGWIDAKRFRGVARLILLVSTVLLLAAYFMLEPIRDTSYFYRVGIFSLAAISAALLILCGLHIVTLARSISTVTKYVAQRSYALYLGHMPVFYLITFYGGGGGQSFGGGLCQWLLFIAGSFLIASFVERFVERPVLAWRDRRIPR